MVTEETPHSGVGVAHILEIDGAVGIAKGELLVGSVIKTILAGKVDHIPCVDTLHLWLSDILQMLAADALEVLRLLGFLVDNKAVVPAFTFTWEKADATQVGVGTDAVVGNAQSHPDSAIPPLPFADNLHNPRLVRVTDGDALATAVVTILFHKLRHAFDSLTSRRRALERQSHETEIIQQPVRVLQFQTAVESALHNGQLSLVHQSHHIVCVLYLIDIHSIMTWPPAVDGDFLAWFMATGRREEQRPCETEAVAVVATHHATVFGSLLPDNQIGACRDWIARPNDRNNKNG